MDVPYDHGPAVAIAQVRAAERSAWKAQCGTARCAEMPFRAVTVVGRYALVDWADENTGGQSLLREDAGRWHRIAHGGGAMDAAYAQTFGVPRAIAVKLFVHEQ
ncbi:MAG TPA: hypothetical protein VMA36_06585 [Candidatus Limnocylindria bacterium]|nr:hypothetical protein [Candidatus Limnocylindria bacterium]